MIGWLQLIRLPNLLTVPGDAMAGYLLAAGGVGIYWGDMLIAAVAGLLFYMGGLALNDLTDFIEDCIHRPSRPLPARAVGRGEATWFVVVCFVLGLFACTILGAQAWIIGIILLLLVMAYNLWCKDRPIIGSLVMGSCRGANLLLGATAMSNLQTPRVVVAALILTLYIAAITELARFETGASKPGKRVWLPAAILLFGWPFIIVLFKIQFTVGSMLGLILVLGAAVSALRLAELMGREKDISIPRCVGQMISALLFLQAAYILLSGSGFLGWILVALFALGWVANQMLTKLFYAS